MRQLSTCQARFDRASPDGTPFPSDLFVVPDDAQLTGVRVDLPEPNCVASPTECAEVDVLNALDGFSLIPRLSIPFDAPIDPNTASSETVFLLRLDAAGATRIGIERRVWDPAANTFYAEPEQTLTERSRYALFVTRGVRDAAGQPAEASAEFRKFRHDWSFGQADDARLKAYRKALIDALDAAEALGVPQEDVIAASVFSTLNATAILEHLRDEIKAAPPPVADFYLAPAGPRTVFPLAQVTKLAWMRQLTITGPLSLAPNPQFGVVKTATPAVGTLAFGRYASKHYLTPAGILANPVPTGVGTPTPIADAAIYFVLLVPAGEKPASGWPTVLMLHGSGSNYMNTGWRVADRFAAGGVATILINEMGFGFGPLSTLTVTRTDGDPVTFVMGGRGIDQTGEGNIDPAEGGGAADLTSLVGSRDAFLQDFTDSTRLVRMIEGGVDIDGDGTVDLDAGKIFAYGHSRGGFEVIPLAAVEPRVIAVVPEAPGLHWAWGDGLPLRGQPPLTVDSATSALQRRNYREVWAGLPGSSLPCAAHLRAAPLDGVPAKRVLIVFGRGDQNIPNPITSALLRASGLADRTLYMQTPLFTAAFGLPSNLNPHSFVAYGNNLSSTFSLAERNVAKATQTSIAQFFLWDGTGVEIRKPLGFEDYFQAPIALPLPEDPGY